MKINIEDYLHKLDSVFKNKPQKEIYITYIMIFSVIFAFSYLLFWESSKKDFDTMNENINKVSNEIAKNETFFNKKPKLAIKKLDRNIKSLNEKLIIFKDNNEFIKSKIETISFLVYNEITWGEYLHKISLNARKFNIKIINFMSKNTNSDAKFGHMLNVDVKFIGTFKNTLRFINSLEQSDLVVDIHSLDIVADEKIETTLKLSVWGIVY